MVRFGNGVRHKIGLYCIVVCVCTEGQQDPESAAEVFVGGCVVFELCLCTFRC